MQVALQILQLLVSERLKCLQKRARYSAFPAQGCDANDASKRMRGRGRRRRTPLVRAFDETGGKAAKEFFITLIHGGFQTWSNVLQDASLASQPWAGNALYLTLLCRHFRDKEVEDLQTNLHRRRKNILQAVAKMTITRNETNASCVPKVARDAVRLAQLFCASLHALGCYAKHMRRYRYGALMLKTVSSSSQKRMPQATSGSCFSWTSRFLVLFRMVP